MVKQHDQHDGHESEQTPGDSEGQGSLVCCSPWVHKESDKTMTENNNKDNFIKSVFCCLSLHKIVCHLVDNLNTAQFCKTGFYVEYLEREKEINQRYSVAKSQ